MDNKKLSKYEKNTAELIFLLKIVFLVSALVVSTIRSDLFWILICAVIIIGFVLARLVKGPLTGPSIIEISDSMISFNDRALGKAEFRLLDIKELRIVGPIKSRRIRVHTKENAYQDVYTDPWGRRFHRAVEFLRTNLPSNISLTEDDPPTWAQAIRGDF